MVPNSADPEVPITVIFSAFVPVDTADSAAASIEHASIQYRALAIDNRQLDYSLGYAVVQAYCHFRTTTKKLCDAINEMRSALIDIQHKVSADVSLSDFVAFAEYWLVPNGSAAQSCFDHQLEGIKKELTVMHATLSDASMASVQFVSRPDREADTQKSVTIIEVPEATEEKNAIGLAFHPERSLETPLCILDLLSAKASWLEHNIISAGPEEPNTNAADDTQKRKPIGAHDLELLLNRTYHSTIQHLKKAFQRTGDPEISTKLARLTGEITVLLAALKMTSTMLTLVKSQIEQINQSLTGYGLRTNRDWRHSEPYPVWKALSGIDYTTRLNDKYQSLFEGLLACTTAGHNFNSDIVLQIATRQERSLSRIFNWLTLMLAAAAFGISATALVDNEMAKALISSFTSATHPSMLAVFIVKLTSCILASAIAAASVYGLHALMQNKKPGH